MSIFDSIRDECLWDCTNGDYHGSVGEDSHSSLDLFYESIEQYAGRRVWRNCPPQEATEAMLFGTLFHSAVLEPEKFEEEYLVAEKHDRRTKVGKAGWAEFVERAEGKTIVEGKDIYKAKAMYDGVCRNPQARALIEDRGRSEYSLRWTDEETGCKLKMRMDKLNWDGTIVDLKTTEHVGPEAWSRTTHNFGYHRQAAMYLEGLQSCLKPGIVHKGRFVFLACSKTPNHECVAYELDFNSLMLGRSQNYSIMKELTERRRTGKWLGRHSDKINIISLPPYAFPRD